LALMNVGSDAGVQREAGRLREALAGAIPGEGRQGL